MIRAVSILALLASAAISAASATVYVKQGTATLRALDKITGRSTDIEVKVGDPIVYGSLKVELKVCYQTPPEERPESAAYLIVNSTQPVAVESMTQAEAASDVETVSEENPLLFSGWMFASSPGLNALEHPVYDIWVIECAPKVEASEEDFARARLREEAEEDEAEDLDLLQDIR